jgi:hypothetical protein
MANQQSIIEVPVKPWFESRAIWLNIIGFGVLIIGIILDSAGQLGISDQVLAWLGVLLAIGNAWLRFSTNQPISTRRGETAVVTAGKGGAETPTFISNRMLHEENVDLAEKLSDIEARMTELWPGRPEPEDPALILPRALVTELEQR